jgi:Tfp pilus assembly protein FimV
MHRYDEFAKMAQAKMQQMNAQLEMAQKILAERDEEIAKLKKKKPAKKSKAVKKKK